MTTKKRTTRKVVNGDIGEPEEHNVAPEDHLAYQVTPSKKGEPVKVQETSDHDGRRVTEITRKTLVTKHVTKDGVMTTVTEPVEKREVMPVFVLREPETEGEPGEVQEYVDEKGRRVKRILRTTTVTKTVTIKGQPVTEQEPEEEVRIVSPEDLKRSFEGTWCCT